MCGIAGIFAADREQPMDRALLERMNEAQLHRGPDAGGLYIAPGIGLAHRRLAIIDLSSGAQPMFNEDKSVVVVYNGEIYNFSELASELKACGHQFATHCDTEVIVHAWEEWGEQCVGRFRGMFAFALWDSNQQTLFLARDRLGIKPLYYSLQPDGSLLFASELKALLQVPGLSREFDACAIEEYFALGYVPEPRSILRDVRKLPPGHCLIQTRDARPATVRQYWDLAFSGAGPVNEADAAVGLIERLSEAVSIRMISEVPIGAFLSGGVDSSAVVALMAQNSDTAITTCTVQIGSAEHDESAWAEQVAQRYQTRHIVERVEHDDTGLLDELAQIYDEPFADSSAIPTYRVCAAARKHVTVALSGDGGDENFAGYRRHAMHMHEERVRSMLPLSLRRMLFGSLGALYPKLDWAPQVLRAKSTLQGLARDSVDGYFHSVSIMPDAWRRRLFSQSFRSRLGGYNAVEVFRAHAQCAPVDHGLQLVQYLDFKTWLPGDILTKVDRASMAHSLEVRVPLLDHQFVEWVAGLPDGMKLHATGGKYLLKKALEPYLSRDILYRKKMGFSVPMREWLRGPLRQRVRDTVLGPGLADTGIFDRSYLQTLVSKHESGARDYSSALWALLMFDASQRKLTSG